jgi:SAM-dependent methyltransferase
MQSALRIKYSIDVAGFQNKLKCGTINLFDGWAANADQNNPIILVQFSVGPTELGRIPIQKDRPDLEAGFHRKKLGFSGVVHIPNQYLGHKLSVLAVAQDGRSQKLREFDLNEALTEAELEFRRKNNVPDDILQNLVVQNTDARQFLEFGKLAVEEIVQVLGDHQVSMDQVRTALDFGVGCGRVMRWWHDYAGRIQFWGTDINESLIEWCRSNLDFGRYSVNALHPPTEFQESQFDLIYAFSVFTHLAFDTQRAWLDEFSRIVAPGKYLLVSAHGDLLAKYLPPVAYDEYKRVGSYVMSEDAEGQNLCAAYQTREFSERLFSSRFVVMDYLPGALKACGIQDLYLLRKPE